MGLFKKKSKNNITPNVVSTSQAMAERMMLANLVLDSITEGVAIVDLQNNIKLLNPSASIMIGLPSPDSVIGINILNILKFENEEGAEISEDSNEIFIALKANKEFTTRDYILINQQKQRKAVAITVTPAALRPARSRCLRCPARRLRRLC